MRYAETGYNLEIDLTRGNIERVETDPKLTEMHLGGLGTNTKILWDSVPPETDPFSPDVPLIFSDSATVGFVCTFDPVASKSIKTTASVTIFNRGNVFGDSASMDVSACRSLAVPSKRFATVMSRAGFAPIAATSPSDISWIACWMASPLRQTAASISRR